MSSTAKTIPGKRRGTYMLVQAYRPKLFQPRKPHARATKIYIWHHPYHHEQWKVWHIQILFLRTLKWLYRRKCDLTNHSPSKRSTHVRRFRRNIFRPPPLIFVSERPASRWSKGCLYKVHSQISQDLTAHDQY